MSSSLTDDTIEKRVVSERPFGVITSLHVPFETEGSLNLNGRFIARVGKYWGTTGTCYEESKSVHVCVFCFDNAARNAHGF